MRRQILLIFSLILVVAVYKTNGQALVTKKDSIVVGQDPSLKLTLQKYRGNVRWQQSNDGKIWVNLGEGSRDTLKVETKQEAKYRAKITEGTCLPIYSDSAKIVFIKATVHTLPTTLISSFSATLNGNISADGGTSVTARGFCWSTSPNPDIFNSKTTNGTGAGTFTGSLAGLTANTLYYVRAYATNSQGTSYGTQETFTTPVIEGTGVFTDSRDGKVYKTVNIGDQWWMSENLAWLPLVSLPSADSNTTPYYYVYDYEGSNVAEAKASANYSTYGVLYNWPAALTACPTGWHLPSDSEWRTLENYLIANGYNYDGTTTGNKIAKSLATDYGWESSTSKGGVGNTDYPAYRNKSGFSALPGGYRSYEGAFYLIGAYGYWWSSTEASAPNVWSRFLQYENAYVTRGNYHGRFGYSVRCIRDL